MSTPKEEAKAYLVKHNLLSLFDELGTSLVHAKPKDATKFLVEQLKLRKQKQNKPFFSETDFRAMFNMFDRTCTGKITGDQFEKALLALGKRSESELNNYTEDMDLETFVNAMQTAQKAASNK